MFDRFDEAELLAYIEDEMSPEQARALESRLRDEPLVREVIERMREDRALLRSAGQPLPRIDFVAELEPQLARPMLIEPRPGSYRRQRHRRVRAARLRRSAAAAAAILIVGGGLWMVFAATGFSPRAWIERQVARGGSDVPAADDGDVGPMVAVGNDEDRSGAGDQWPPADEAVHHWGPLPSVALSTDRALARSDDETERHPAGAARPTLHTASFAIVLRGDDGTATQLMERGLQRMGGALGGRTDESLALVRNFSFDEARAMIEEYLVNAPAGSVSEPLRTALDPDSPTVSVKDRLHVRRSLANGLRAARASEDEQLRQKWSRRLLGPESVAPDYERQLDFSSRGAALTASVPAARLETLLGTLFDESAGSMTLRAFGDASASPDRDSPAAASATALQRWLRDLASIREEIAELRRTNPRAQLLIPVVIEPPAAR